MAIDEKGLAAACKVLREQFGELLDRPVAEAAIRAYLKATETTQIGQQAIASKTSRHVHDECDD